MMLSLSFSTSLEEAHTLLTQAINQEKIFIGDVEGQIISVKSEAEIPSASYVILEVMLDGNPIRLASE